MSYAERLAPGVYSVGGELHLVVDELLEGAGYEASEANVELVTRLALERFAQLDIPLVFCAAPDAKPDEEGAAGGGPYPWSGLWRPRPGG